MLAGKYAGQKIAVVKKKIQDELIASGGAALYVEPEKKVLSRSGDECVVALCDQWWVSHFDLQNLQKTLGFEILCLLPESLLCGGDVSLTFRGGQPWHTDREIEEYVENHGWVEQPLD